MPDDDNDDDYIKGRQIDSILFSVFLLFALHFLGLISFPVTPSTSRRSIFCLSNNQPFKTWKLTFDLINGIHLHRHPKCLPGLLEPENVQNSKIQICPPQARPAKALKWASFMSLKMLHEYEKIIF